MIRFWENLGELFPSILPHLSHIRITGTVFTDWMPFFHQSVSKLNCSWKLLGVFDSLKVNFMETLAAVNMNCLAFSCMTIGGLLAVSIVLSQKSVMHLLREKLVHIFYCLILHNRSYHCSRRLQICCVVDSFCAWCSIGGECHVQYHFCVEWLFCFCYFELFMIRIVSWFL